MKKKGKRGSGSGGEVDRGRGPREEREVTGVSATSRSGEEISGGLRYHVGRDARVQRVQMYKETASDGLSLMTIRSCGGQSNRMRTHRYVYIEEK